MSTVHRVPKAVLTLWLLFSTTHSHASSKLVTFTNFSALRAHLTNLIGGAKKSIHLKTDSLTDGDVAEALILAKYRKIAVRVSLSEQHIDSPMSHYQRLKQQGITMDITANQFIANEDSQLVIDRRRYMINSPISGSYIRQNYQVKLLSGREKPPILAAGSKPRHNKGSVLTQHRSKNELTVDTSGGRIYNYDRQKTRTARPRGVAHKLPSRPKYLLRNSIRSAPAKTKTASYWDLNPVVIREPIFLNPKNRESR